MKNKIKNFTYWLEVAALGIVLGLIIQGARAWQEPPAGTPPEGNVDAPINTGANLQTKSGSLELLGQLITSYINVPGDVPVAGDVLTAQNASGQVAWQPAGGSGGWYVPSDVKNTSPASHNGDFGGFDGMYNWIQTHGCAGYHVCTMNEMINYAQMHGNGSFSADGFFAEFYSVYASAPASHISFCQGFTNTSDNVFVLKGTFPSYEVDYCSRSHLVMCCK
jgi:hypothetical protein